MGGREGRSDDPCRNQDAGFPWEGMRIYLFLTIPTQITGLADFFVFNVFSFGISLFIPS